MLNPVNNAVKEIMYAIPEPILTYIFGHEDVPGWRRAAPVSIDEMIKSKVIRPRVLKECNLIGGREININLQGLQAYQQDTYTSIYEIPLERTGNREIMSVLSVSYLPDSTSMGSMGTPYASVNPVTQSDVATAGQRVMDSFSNVPHISTAQVELIGYNTVSIRDVYRPTITYQLRCRISNEEELSNLQPRSYEAFAEACLHAVKSYIFNKAWIQIDRGRLEQGQDLGSFRETIEGYRDEEREYKTFMKEKMQKILYMNDTTTYGRFLTVQINPGL